MKETIPLSLHGNGDGNDGTGSANASADNRSGSDDAARLDGITGESGARRGAIDDGSDELPLGDGGYKRKRKRSAVESKRSASVGVDSLRIGGGGSGGSRSRTDSDSTNASASGSEEGETSSASGIPREITLESLGKSKEKKEKYTPNTNLSSEFIAEGIGLLFHAAAILLNDDEWKLPEEDATELAERTKKWARQGSKNIAAFEKKLARWEPMMMLIFGLAAVILPRIIHTRAKRNALRTPQKETATGNGSANRNGTAPIASVQGSNGGNVAGDATRRSVDVGSGGAANGAEIIPFRRQDWREIPGIDD